MKITPREVLKKAEEILKNESNALKERLPVAKEYGCFENIQGTTKIKYDKQNELFYFVMERDNKSKLVGVGNQENKTSIFKEMKCNEDGLVYRIFFKENGKDRVSKTEPQSIYHFLPDRYSVIYKVNDKLEYEFNIRLEYNKFERASVKYPIWTIGRVREERLIIERLRLDDEIDLNTGKCKKRNQTLSKVKYGFYTMKNKLNSRKPKGDREH